jgi:hypothetical protein
MRAEDVVARIKRVQRRLVDNSEVEVEIPHWMPLPEPPTDGGATDET